MGVAELRELAVVEPMELDELAGSTGAVDALNWLYRYMTIAVTYTNPVAYTTEDGTEVPNLLGLVRGLPKFFELDLFPVFVFDGEVTRLKQSELNARRKRRRRAAERAAKARERGDTRKAARYKARAQRITAPIDRTTRELLELLDIPYFEAPSEAEAQAAHMARNRAVDYVVTDDYDALLYGAPRTVRKFTSQGKPECMDFQSTLEMHSVTWRQLVDIAIFCGTDYNDGVRGFGPDRALAEIKEHGDLESVLNQEETTIENAERIRNIFLDPVVTDDYEFDRTIAPNLEAAYEYVTETWEIPEHLVERTFHRLEKNQHRWS